MCVVVNYRALLLAALDIIVEEAFPDILSEMIAS